ncbi:MAG: hypothetical protein KL787_00660 [Taibaiella sp.]|nr:hypothetical protein [Taibaiella sp.]MBX9448302.1 hypothetical protein [Taibaiella sp.]
MRPVAPQEDKANAMYASADGQQLLGMYGDFTLKSVSIFPGLVIFWRGKARLLATIQIRKN